MDGQTSHRKGLRIRARLGRLLSALPNMHTTRALLLAVLLRRAPDCYLPKLARLARAERRSQRFWTRIKDSSQGLL